MKVTISIDDAENLGEILGVSSSSDAAVTVSIGDQTCVTECALIERAIANAMNTGVKPSDALKVRSAIAGTNGSELIVENHATDRELVVAVIGKVKRVINGRDMLAAARKC